MLSEKMKQAYALFQLHKSVWSMKNHSQSEYIGFMSRSAWILVVAALIIYVLQVYSIHRVFSRNRSPLTTVQYRMKV